MVKILNKVGFVQVSQRGSHIKLKRHKLNNTDILIVPNHDELAPGTFRNILRVAQVSLEQFDKLR